ncbi:MAG: peptidoglycan DD-metalloendopeptidase family protein [Saprospiraceae bacterium]|nr:peptidoglycan DD-metalloendopeptidase family protein [Saprospiraceae bacterium]
MLTVTELKRRLLVFHHIIRAQIRMHFAHCYRRLLGRYEVWSIVCSPLILSIVLSTCPITVYTVAAQSRAELESAQKKLQEKINLTSKLLGTVTKDKAHSLTELSLLENQITTRKRLVKNYQQELVKVKKDKQSSKKKIEHLQERRDRLSRRYAGILRASHRSSFLQNRWLFILSSLNFNQMYMRWQYLKQVNTAWKKQLTQLKEAEEALDLKISELASLEKKRTSVLKLEKEEQHKLIRGLSKQETLLASLGKKEKELRRELEEHAKARSKLRTAIEKIIRERTGSGSSTAELPLTPALAKLAASFVASKGSLPWPVEKGIISRTFGKQKHPALRQVTTVNNGVDIKTDINAGVRALYSGTVVGTQFIPGYDHMLILAHGNYYTVYSFLSEVTVQKGDKVVTAQQVGKARSKGGIGEVHLEVWKGRELLNPSQWLMSIQ